MTWKERMYVTKKRKEPTERRKDAPWPMACSGEWSQDEIKTAARCAIVQAAFERGDHLPYGVDPNSLQDIPEELSDHTVRILDRWGIPLPDELSGILDDQKVQ